MTSLNPSLRLALINKAKSKKNLLQKGFTLVELMVVVAIVGALSAVAIPKFTDAQGLAKGSAAKQEAVNAGRVCTIAILAGDSTGGDTVDIDDGNIKHTGTTCGPTAAFAYEGGSQTWTVTMKDGVASKPAES